MNLGEFLRLFHALENPVYKGFEVFEFNLPATRSFNTNPLSTEHLNFVRHIVEYARKIYKRLNALEREGK